MFGQTDRNMMANGTKIKSPAEEHISGTTDESMKAIG